MATSQFDYCNNLPGKFLCNSPEQTLLYTYSHQGPLQALQNYSLATYRWLKIFQRFIFAMGMSSKLDNPFPTASEKIPTKFLEQGNRINKKNYSTQLRKIQAFRASKLYHVGKAKWKIFQKEVLIFPLDFGKILHLTLPTRYTAVLWLVLSLI